MSIILDRSYLTRSLIHSIKSSEECNSYPNTWDFRWENRKRWPGSKILRVKWMEHESSLHLRDFVCYIFRFLDWWIVHRKDQLAFLSRCCLYRTVRVSAWLSISSGKSCQLPKCAKRSESSPFTASMNGRTQLRPSVWWGTESFQREG
jgi:hypothetical protein